MPAVRRLLIGITLLLGACAAPKDDGTLKTSFDVKEVAWSTGKGNNTITGEAIIPLANGEKRTCQSYTPQIVPDSPYARERLERLYGNTQEAKRAADHPTTCLSGPHYPGYRETHRTTKCQANGSFTFTNVPDGVWYVVVPVIWQAKHGEPYQGGTFMQRVEVKGGATARVILGGKE